MSTQPTSEQPKSLGVSANANTSTDFQLPLTGPECFTVGHQYLSAREIPIALKLFEHGANVFHNADCQYAIGSSYDTNDPNSDGDMSKAREYYLLAAEQNHMHAQEALAISHWNGEGGPKNFDEAIKWFLKASEQNSPEAQWCLSLMAKRGQGMEPSIEKHVEWGAKAAIAGHTMAQYFMCTLYLDGLHGYQKDLIKAREWCTKSAKQGYFIAQMRLRELTSEATDVTETGR